MIDSRHFDQLGIINVPIKISNAVRFECFCNSGADFSLPLVATKCVAFVDGGDVSLPHQLSIGFPECNIA